VIIGQDLEADKARFTISPEGIVVVPKGAKIGFE
jgi:glucose-1-phosphate adenylyltransferase